MVAFCCIATVLGIFFGDFYVKNRIEKKGDCLPRAIMGGRILLKRHHNRGAFLNLGQGRRTLVAVLSVALSLVLTFVFLASLGQRGNNLLRIGLSLLLGGAFNNTYDRLKRQYVVDYFSFNIKWKRIRSIVFNLSDFCIIIGALLIILGTS